MQCTCRHGPSHYSNCLVSQFQYQMLPSGEKTTSGSSLTLANVTRLDSGNYICTASNGVDRAVEAKIKLVVICKCFMLIQFVL